MRWLESLAADATSLASYLRAIARFPDLTGAEERQLAQRVQRRDDDALARLAGSQLRLVVGYALIYRHLGVPLADLVHDGNLGLVDAARRFDPAAHGRFASYALWWVRQGVLHRLSQQRPGLGLPDDDRAACLAPALRAAIDRACAGSPAESGRADDRHGLDEPWRLTPEIDRLDDEEIDLDDIGTLLVESGADEVRLALASELGLSLLELEPKERRTLELRLGLLDGEPRTVDQTGDRLRISSDRVERLSVRAIQKLRRQRSVRSSLN